MKIQVSFVAVAVAAAVSAASSPLAARQNSDSIQGGVIYNAPSGDAITSISGTFVVPTQSIPIQGPYANRASGIYAFSVNIGIGGYPGFGSQTGCAASTGAIRAGIDVYYNAYDDQAMPAFAWYQYGVGSTAVANGGAFAYAGFNVESGDLVRVTATADSSVSAVLENFGKVSSTAGRSPVQKAEPTYGVGNTQAGSICRGEASWLVEDHTTETEPPLAKIMGNFTDIVFTDMTAKTKSGATFSVAGSKLVNINIKDQGGQITECAAAGAAELRCKRVVKAAGATRRADGTICED